MRINLFVSLWIASVSAVTCFLSIKFRQNRFKEICSTLNLVAPVSMVWFHAAQNCNYSHALESSFDIYILTGYSISSLEKVVPVEHAIQD